MLQKELPKPIGKPEVAYQGKIIQVVRQKMQIGEKEKVFEFARRAPGVRLIIVSEENKVLITKEYRTEIEGWDYRLPGGKVCDSLETYLEYLEEGEDKLQLEAEKAAGKEAREEVAIDIQKLEHYHTSTSGGPTIKWDLYYFVATDFEIIEEGQSLELGENIKVEWHTFEEAREICLSGKMHEDRSVGVLLKFLHQEQKD